MATEIEINIDPKSPDAEQFEHICAIAGENSTITVLHCRVVENIELIADDVRKKFEAAVISDAAKDVQSA